MQPDGATTYITWFYLEYIGDETGPVSFQDAVKINLWKMRGDPDVWSDDLPLGSRMIPASGEIIDDQPYVEIDPNSLPLVYPSRVIGDRPNSSDDLDIIMKMNAYGDLMMVPNGDGEWGDLRVPGVVMQPRWGITYGGKLTGHTYQSVGPVEGTICLTWV